MKRISCILMTIVLFCTALCAEGAEVKIYTLDGRAAKVDVAEKDLYLSLGWYETYAETIQTVYALDGRSLTVYKAEVPSYLAVGWYETYAETIQTVYALDGRSLTVYKAEVPSYLAVGWFETYAETIQTVYALDGRSLTVYKAEVPSYLAVGWYETYAETVQTVYALDGRNLTVYKAEVPSYVALGWYETYEETVETLYDRNGNSIVVYKAEVAAYLELGWSLTKETGPMIALTFDDGPSPIHTASILNTLEAYNAKATFFVLGSQADAYPALVQRAHTLGCDIGSHTYSHPNLNTCTAAGVYAEIGNTSALINRLTGENPPLLRPPYGNHNATVRNAAGVPLILWNVDTLDWKTRNAQAVAQHVLNHAYDGSIVLMHDIYGSTADAVKVIVPALIERGFRLVTVRELAMAKGINLNAGQAYYSF